MYQKEALAKGATILDPSTNLIIATQLEVVPLVSGDRDAMHLLE